MPDEAIRRPEGLKVTYRRMKFPFEEHGFPRYWHAGSPFRSYFWTQLSTAFDPGERFFIDSARALKGEIKDPALQEEIVQFCRQEGHHTAQHLKFDEINAEMGVDVEGCRLRYQRVLDRARRKLDPMEMLAATAGLEHFTASLAEHYIENPFISAGVDPNVEPLWRWHAIEELEHKATCFDIYRQLGGSELKRATIMAGSWFLILWIAMVNTFVLLRKDRKLFTRDTWQGLGYLFGKNGFFSGLGPAFRRYLRPSFHPWKTDTSHLVREWEAGNAQYILRA